MAKWVVPSCTETDRMREALKFYADETNYHERIVGGFRTTPVDDDRGRIARAALGGKDD